MSDEGSGNKRLLPQKKISDADADEDDDDDDDENSEIEYESENEIDDNKKGKKLPNLQKSEAEVNTLLYDLSKIVIKNPESNTNGDRTDVIMPDKNDDFTRLNMKLGEGDGVEIESFNCACHKANIAVNKTINAHPEMKKDLKAIAKYTKRIRKTKVNKLFAIEKCRLHCANKTRWSSGFLNLYSVYKAYKRGLALDGCPLTLEKVEFYLQILLPSYRFSIGFQRTKSIIGEVLPAVLLLCNTYAKLATNIEFQPICLTMIESFKYKFDYELNSNIYLVATLLNTSKLNIWYWKTFSESFATKAKEQLINFASGFIGIEDQQIVGNTQNITNNNPVNTDDDDDLLFRLLANDDDEIGGNNQANDKEN